jgi:hypothetical protein
MGRGCGRRRRPRQQNAVHRTTVSVDVEGFCDRRRTNVHQIQVRRGLYRVLHRAFTQSGVSWDDCRREDRGDGVFVLASSELTKARFSELLPGALLDALHDHNRTHPPPAQIQLHMVLHAGEVTYDSFGVTGTAINHAFRLLDAHALKARTDQIAVSQRIAGDQPHHNPRASPQTRLTMAHRVAMPHVSCLDHSNPAFPARQAYLENLPQEL